MKINGKGRRQKGLSFERKIARDLFDFDKIAKRNLEYQEGNGVDVEGKDFVIQCKAGKNIHWLDAYQQIKKESEKFKAVVGKLDHQGEYVFMKWDDFLEFYKWFIIRSKIESWYHSSDASQEQKTS